MGWPYSGPNKMVLEVGSHMDLDRTNMCERGLGSALSNVMLVGRSYLFERRAKVEGGMGVRVNAGSKIL